MVGRGTVRMSQGTSTGRWKQSFITLGADSGCDSAPLAPEAPG